MVQASTFQNITALEAKEIAAAKAHEALPVEPATPPSGIEWMAMLEQMQAKMTQVEPKNERFKLIFASDPSEAQPPGYFMTP